MPIALLVALERNVRRSVGDITQLFHHSCDPLAGPLRYGLRVAQIAADCHLGHAGLVGDILQGGAALAGGAHRGVQRGCYM